MPSRRAISCVDTDDAFSRIISRAWRIVIRSAGTDRSLGLPKGRPDQANGGARPPIHERPRAGSFRYGGRDHLGIGGRHHSVTGGGIIQELGGGFLRNQQWLPLWWRKTRPRRPNRRSSRLGPRGRSSFRFPFRWLLTTIVRSASHSPTRTRR